MYPRLLLLACVSLVGAEGCRRAKVEEGAHPVVDERAEPTRAELGASVCAGRPTCTVLDVKSAGKDAEGTLLFVLRVTTKPELADASHLDLDAGDCVPFEHWLVRAKRASILDRREVLRVCNDGYGASGVGDDVVEIAPNLLTHTQNGGSAWRWESKSVLQLSPLLLARTESWSGNTLSAAVERTVFDWVAFRGHARWFKPPCPASGAPPDPPKELDPSLTKDTEDLYVYDPIPLLAALPPDFGTVEWKRTSLDSCAAYVDGIQYGEHSRGYTIHGAPPAQGEQDATMRVLATGKDTAPELFVEVVDDVFVTGSANFLHDDHVELWWKDPDVDPSELCVPGSAGGGAGRLRQWLIRVSDGKLVAGFGAPTLGTDPIEVERVDHVDRTGAKAMRLRIKLSAPVDALTVVYSDGDDGKTQERLIATSRLKFGKRETLGHLFAVSADEARCDKAKNVLVRKPTRVFPADRPVLGTSE